MSETKPLSRELHLELENMSLKLHILKRNLVDQEKRFQDAVEGAFEKEGTSKDEWSIDLDRGMFVKKNV